MSVLPEGLSNFLNFLNAYITTFSPIAFYAMGLVGSNLVEETYKRMLLLAFSGLISFIMTSDPTHILIASFFFIYASLTFHPQEKRPIV